MAIEKHSLSKQSLLIAFIQSETISNLQVLSTQRQMSLGIGLLPYAREQSTTLNTENSSVDGYILIKA
ncbi:uncharacterized protein LAJ45_09040 [Morchella importuna]|uniref:uncharacterized protein n=1 Tax=Morchella importuna TaxID=1174673 RepID=UPI001E8EEA0E|nr:uncharacterized protein LAJ45_09040 [Morchella importuna]KAH8146960.1 hypothetical protein LAJ45_09040 [Morchella importuna]